MAKNSIRDFDATSSNNTDIQSVNIAEGCAPSGINNAIRELMTDLKNVSAGTIALESPSADSLTVTGDLTVDTSTLKVDSTNNRVGILETSPTVPLEVKGAQAFASSASNLSTSTTKAAAKIRGSSDSSTALFFGSITNDAEQYIQSANGAGSAADDIVLNPFGGTVMIAQTANDSGVAGHILNNNGTAFHIRDGGTVFVLNRLTDDGVIADFRKDGTTVGSILNNSTNLKVNGVGALELSENGTTRVYVDSGGFFPFADNTYDIGSGGLRFDDIFATNGTIQTSDQNEKQQIASLTDAEITAAKALSKLFKTFKWNDSVAAKGENARTHAGHIAQDVSSAMTDAGLDATKYAFFCSDTWWETQTEVPAVEAVEAQDAVYEDVVIEAVLDDDGNEIEAERTEHRLVSEAVEAVEARDAYTRTDIYDTADEAPEGATERTRLGIRYPELLAFVGAATEQRLTSIETRLTALEG